MTKEIFEGDDDNLEFTVTKSDGSALDLTNMTVVWGLGDSPSGNPTLTKSTANTGEIDVVDAVNGRFDVLLVSSDTDGLGGASHYHEVEITDTNDDDFTVFEGRLYIKPTMV